MERRNRGYDDYGLIGKLYHYVLGDAVFKELNKSNNNSEKYPGPRHYFQMKWLGIKCPIEKYWKALAKEDVFASFYMEAVRERIANEKDFENDVNGDLNNLIIRKKIDKDKIINGLVDALETTDSYKEKITDDESKNYSDETIEARARLIDHCNEDREFEDVPHFIRCYIYFAMNLSLPPDLTDIMHEQQDLKEVMEMVVARHGLTTRNAIREIIKLTDRENPNMVALCEYADLLFYGNAEGIKQDIAKAFYKYKEAACVYDDSKGVKKSYKPSAVALWSLAYIYLNYRKPNPNTNNIEENTYIEEIANMNDLDRFKQAYSRARQAYTIAKLPSAANTLGLIAQFSDNATYPEKRCKGIDEFKKEKKMEECSYWFKKAAEAGYVYAYNNLAVEECHQIFATKDNPDEQRQHIKNYLMYMEKSANEKEPWAANKLGRTYLNGIEIKHPESQEIEYIKDEVVDKDKAYDFFMKAYKCYSVYYDINCIRASANLYKYFENRLSNSDLEEIRRILQKHIDNKDVSIILAGKPIKPMDCG